MSRKTSAINDRCPGATESTATDPSATTPSARDIDRRRLLGGIAGAAAAASLAPAALAQGLLTARDEQVRFRRIATQFIAALAPPDATSGDNAQDWGLWRLDPGPRGVTLAQFERLKANGGVAPAGWQFDGTGWWLEEHGLIMEAPEFPLPAGKYMVTGNRTAKSVLSVEPPAADGRRHWSLDDGPNIYDVTHLRCRSAVYTPGREAGTCTPAAARQSDFPVAPGAEMPPVAGCSKQDYAVLIVIGVAV